MTTIGPSPQSATLTPDQQEARAAVAELTARWAGKPVGEWTRQRAENVRAVSSWKRARRAGELPTVYDTMLGPRFVEMVARGACFPYPLLQRQGVRVVLPPGASWKLTDRHTRALGFVVAAHLGCKTKGLIISHATMAELLACSPRTAGTVMRQLASWNLLEVQPWFEPAGATNLRQSSLYRVSAFAVALFDIRPRRVRAAAPLAKAPAASPVLPDDSRRQATPSCSAPGEFAPGSAVVRAWQDLPSRTIAPKGAEQEGVACRRLSSGRTGDAAGAFASGSSVDPAAPVGSSGQGEQSACAVCGGSTVPLDSPDPVFDRRCSSCDWFGRRPKERMNIPAKLAAYADKRIAAAESRVLGVLRNLRAREEYRDRDRAQLAQLAPLVAPEPAREPTAEELADRQRFAQKRAEDRAAQRAKREADDFDEVLDRAMKSWEYSAGARQDLPRGRN